MRILFAMLAFGLLLVNPAEARTTWIKPHITKNGGYVSGHYMHHKSHISHVAKHRKHQS